MYGWPHERLCCGVQPDQRRAFDRDLSQLGSLR